MSTEKDNQMVWGRRPGHYEVWYATLSHRESGTGFWIRYTLESPRDGLGEPWAELWFARFDASDPAQTFGIHRRFPISALHDSDNPFSISIGDSEVRNDGMRGGLAGGGHEVRWSLSWRPAEKTHYLLPGWAYQNPLVITKVLSPNQNVLTDGEIIVDGRRYELHGDPLGQTHLWGKKHAYAWAWGHCNAFDDPAVSLEALSVRLKRGSIILPTLTLFTLNLDGELLDFRQPWSLPLARATFHTGKYHFVGMNAHAKLEGEFTCRPDDMLLTEYVDPDGDPAFCHNSCAADLTVTLWRRSPFVGRFREDRKLTVRRMGHFEWAARAGDAFNVKRVHTSVG